MQTNEKIVRKNYRNMTRKQFKNNAVQIKLCYFFFIPKTEILKSRNLHRTYIYIV